MKLEIDQVFWEVFSQKETSVLSMLIILYEQLFKLEWCWRASSLSFRICLKGNLKNAEAKGVVADMESQM